MEEYIETIIEDTEEPEIIEFFEDSDESINIYENVLNEVDPTVPEHVKAITKEDIAKWDKGKSYTAGENIDITDDGVISILTAPNVEKDNTKPITSAAVYTEVGNINVLLQTI